MNPPPSSPRAPGFRRLPESWSLNPESRKRVEEAIACISPDDTRLASWYRRYSQRQKKRLVHDVDYVHRYVGAHRKILEFGSLPPILTTVLSRAGYEVCGLDLKPERFRSAIDAESLDIRKLDFETQPLPFEDGEYDAAVFNEVFEHLRINPIFTMREVHRVLKPDGVLLLSTPNLTSWKGWYFFAAQGRLAPDVYNEFAKLERLGHMGHVRVYSVGEVTRFLHKLGFEVEVVIHRGEFQSPVRWKKWMGDAFLRLFPRLRTSFSVVARKPAPVPEAGGASPSG